MNEVRKVQERFSLLARFLESGLFAKCRILFRLRRLNLNSSDMRTMLKRLLPEPVFVRLRFALACARTPFARG
jgi:hypothetical protein